MPLMSHYTKSEIPLPGLFNELQAGIVIGALFPGRSDPGLSGLAAAADDVGKGRDDGPIGDGKTAPEVIPESDA
jgi:hypothetical protein